MFDFARKIFGQNRLTTLSCMPPYFAATYSLIGENYESSHMKSSLSVAALVGWSSQRDWDESTADQVVSGSR